MENVEIVRTLTEIGDLLEIRGGAPFKVRAYRNAVRTIANLTRPLSGMVLAGEDLTKLPGIGRDIAGYIGELVRTGRTQRLDELERDMPATVADLTRLEGIGPVRARMLHEVLGIGSVGDLKRALDAGDVGRVPGFGPKTVEKIRRSVHRRKRPARFKLSEADRFVRTLLDHMSRAPGLERIEAAGSYRRRTETVGDIDLLAICADPHPVMSHFANYDGIARLVAAGGTRGTAILDAGLQVDLRILPRESYGAALHYFTGSKAHNVAVRRLGVARRLRISEYGVFRSGRGAGGARGRRIAGDREEDVFEAVGMDWVPPELREDRGEIVAALEGRLPGLISLDDIRGDLQMHSTWSDGRDSVEAMARACLERGYEYMAITDHSRALAVAGGLGPRQLEQQWQEIGRVQRDIPELRILRGMEVDILRDGSLDLPDEYLDRLDIVVASVHSAMNQPKNRMTDRVIRALEHPSVHVLAHPTGRLINQRPPFAIDIDAVLRAAAALGVAVELNAQPHRLDLRDVQVRRATELGVQIAISTDAHSVQNLAFMAYGVDQARRGWLERDDVVNTMSRSRLERWLRRDRPGQSRRAGSRGTAGLAGES